MSRMKLLGERSWSCSCIMAAVMFIGASVFGEAAWIDDQYKLLVTAEGEQLFDIKSDPAEKADLALTLPEVRSRMKVKLAEWKSGVMAELAEVP